MARTLLITGCSSGIGYHAAHALRERGWKVVASARKPEDVKRLQSEGLPAVRLDLADEASVEAGFAEALKLTGGGLDALFNNGGYSQPGAVEDLETAALRAQFETNFFGWHALTRRAIPVMRRQGQGRIVFCSSVLGLVAMGFRGAYVASKFAVEGYADALRVELAATGLRVSSIEPGPIETKMAENALKMLEANVDWQRSVHRNYYGRRIESLKRGGNTAGQLGPEAVTKALVHALESRRPRTHYHVTSQTVLTATARRLLPGRLLHRLITRATG